MPARLSQSAFCSLVMESGLVPEDRLKSLRAKFAEQHPGAESRSCVAFTEYLVRQDVLTLWQAKKLLQGKHKGFLLGKYKLLSLLGRGGMSSVYLAEHLVMRRRCAIKILPFKQVKNAASLDRFYREAQAVASLDDPNIVRAYDFDQLTEGANEIHYLVMEYVNGRSLQQVVDDDGPLPIAEAVGYVRQAASGLAHAHSAGVVHRDVKPSNLLLDESGTIKLLDLGLARIYENAEQASLTIEHQQTVLGTADYLSPEQAVDSHGVDHRSDIYSLGCTLYFLLTGHPPFPVGTLTQRLLAHQNKEPAPVVASRPEVPQTLATLLGRMMAKHPDDRFETARDLCDALTAWLDHQPEEAPATAARLRKRSRRKKARRRSRQRPADSTATKRRETTASAPPSASSQGRTEPSETRPGQQRQDTTTRGKTRPLAPDHISLELERGLEGPGSDDDLTSFLQSLGTTTGHETDAPSFSAADTIVAGDELRLRKPPDNADRPVIAPGQSDPAVLRPSSADLSDGARRGAAASGEGESAVGTSDISGSEFGKPDKPDMVARIRDAALEIIHRFRQSLRWDEVSPKARRAMIGASLLLLAMAVAFVAVGGRDQGERIATDRSDVPPDTSDAPPVSTIPDIEPGAPVTVGPDGHFATIGEALAYVRETFHPLHPSDALTIRVAGGQTYDERIVIDNSQLRSFPQGVRLVCNDAEPAVLQPTGADPIVDLRTVERFHLEGFTLRGSGQPTLVRLEGYLVHTALVNLDIEGAGEAAIRGVGTTGFSGGDRLTLQGITVSKPLAAAVAMQFEAGPTPTKNVLIRRCRILRGFDTGIRIAGGVSGIEIAECVFDACSTGIQFDNSPELWEDVAVTNVTFRAFNHGIHLQRSPTPSDGRFHFDRNLFTEARGPECLIDGRPSSGTSLPANFSASFNWTQRPAPTAPHSGEVDLFEQDGRRGAGITFQSIDPNQRSTYLRPENPELREASARIPQSPKYIGAVPPAAE